MSPSPTWNHEANARADLAPRVQARSFGGELILLDTSGGDYYAVADAGRSFVLRLTEGASVEQAARAVHAEYEVAWTELCSDLLSLFGDLVSRGLLVPRQHREEETTR